MRTAKSILVVVGLAFLAAGCPSKRPEYPTCERDEDCREGERCVDRRCVTCVADADCPAGQECADGACRAIAGWCERDGDCPDGQVCKDNRCSPCESDDECGDGFCVGGRCSECRTDDDCPEDQDCVNGRCVAPTAATATGPRCSLATVYFDFDQATVREDARSQLEQTAECLRSEGRRAAVVGHTDPRGPEEYNIALSDRRARAVADFLARLGVDAGILRVVPKGEAEATGSDEAGWARDRKVEFTWD
jgi:peptidoglycan-associated lipoprotein